VQQSLDVVDRPVLLDAAPHELPRDAVLREEVVLRVGEDERGYAVGGHRGS